MFSKSISFLFIIGFSLIFMGVQHVQSAEAKKTAIPRGGFEDWVKELRKEALSKGISSLTLDEALAEIQLVEKVIKLDRKQPYKTKTFEEYIHSVVPASRVKKAQAKYQENKALLEEIGQKYQVQPRFIVALWGVESDFGRRMGSFSIVNALATLAFDGRRSAFFRKELLHALTILDEGHIKAKDMKGSWAGAMGQTQFMPSSFISYAVDYDGDGKRDIWHSKADAFASIANYLSRRGWDYSATWGRKVSIPEGFDLSLVDLKQSKTLPEWQNLGARSANGQALPNRRLDASMVMPNKKLVGEQAFLVYSNYKTLLKWNRSTYFATAVGLLSDKIGQVQ